METNIRRPVAPFYAVAVIWLGYALLFPLYAPLHYVLLAAVSAAAFLAVNALCKNAGVTGGTEQAAPKAAEKPREEATGDAELDKMLKNGRLAIEEMKRLDDNIADEGISADIVRLEQVSQKIFDEVKRDPKKRPQIQRFMDYYLPTTLKLLENYASFEEAGVSGENLSQAKAKIEKTMDSIVAGFEHQLDELYRTDAMDIDSDIRVMETMLRRDTASVADDFGLNGSSAVQQRDE